jgi:hypothetical protein
LCLSLFSAGVSPAHAASDTWNQISILGSNGQIQVINVFGHPESLNGGTGNLLVEDNTIGMPTGRVFQNGVQIGTTTTEVPVVVQQLGPVQTHTLYAAENYPYVLYKNQVRLMQIGTATGSNGVLSYSAPPVPVTCPYSSLSGDWLWMIYQYSNPNNWPIVAYVHESLQNGESFNGYEYFAANQTKYLKLNLNSNIVGKSISFLATDAQTHQNLDPVAPPQYVNDPEADDRTGVNWTAGEWEGLAVAQGGSSGVVANGTYVPFYTSKDFWALRPGFVTAQTWVPNPGEDSHWGTVQTTTTPGFMWGQQAGFSAYLSNGSSGTLLVDANGMPGMPYVVSGYDVVKTASLTATWNKNGVNNYSWTNVSFVQHVDVANPGPSPVTFNLTGGVEDYDTYLGTDFTTPAADQGTVTIPPGGSVWLTSTFTGQTKNYQGQVTATYYPRAFYGSGGYSGLIPGFGVGCTRPIGSRYFSWTASGIANQDVAYDYGVLWGNQSITGYSVNSSYATPGFIGAMLDNVTGMTASDLARFLGYNSKIQQVENSGYATWSAQSYTANYSGKNNGLGHYSYVKAS